MNLVFGAKEKKAAAKLPVISHCGSKYIAKYI